MLAGGWGCGLVAPDGKESVPPDHDDRKGGAYHKAGAEEPYRSPGNCATFGCHHVNLRGGWARYDETGSPDTPQARSPSCYQCHGVEWTIRYPASIQVQYPTSDVVWRHGGSRPIEWWGPRTDTAAVYLYDGDTLVDTLQTMHATEGVARIDSVRTAWGTGDAFRIRIEQGSGDAGFGQSFQICGADEGVQVTVPAAGAVVMQGEELRVEWHCAAGVAVDIFVYDGDVRIDTFRRGAGNGGFATRTFPVSWGTGTDYRIQIVDAEGTIGFSEPFEIRTAP